MEAFDITSVQAQAILELRLRRLTALELGELKRDYEQVVKLIASSVAFSTVKKS